MNAKWFLTRGLAAGAIAGAVTALFLRFVTETQIGYALRFEEATGIGLPPGEAAEFSRGTQQWGGMAGAVVYGAVLGLVLGVTVAALHHRLRGRNEFERIGKVALGAFVGLVLIPNLKYPPNPPTVGDPGTINQRTTDFLLLLAASIVVVFVTWFVWERLTERGWDGAGRFAAGAGLFVVLVAALFLVYPASPDPIVAPDNEAPPALTIADDAPPEVLAAILETARANGDGWIRDPNDPEQPLDLAGVSDPSQLAGVPAAVNTTKLVPNAYTTVVWHFRIDSMGGLAVMWTVMAVALGWFAEAPVRAAARLARHERAPSSPEGVASA